MLLDQFFNDRLTEIDSYLDLLSEIEKQVRSGPPRLGGENGPSISAVQLRILYSSVYLQLYNLVEATINKCIESLCDAISDGNRWRPSDLTQQLRREWVRFLARTHTDLTFENRLENSLNLCRYLIEGLPVGEISIEKGGGGNWNDEEIFRLAERLGCTLDITPASTEAVKRPFRDDLGALGLIRKQRNDLAHGTVSFGECGDGLTVDELKDLRTRTASYLNEVVKSFKKYIADYSYLDESKRPSEQSV